MLNCALKCLKIFVFCQEFSNEKPWEHGTSSARVASESVRRIMTRMSGKDQLGRFVGPEFAFESGRPRIRHGHSSRTGPETPRAPASPAGASMADNRGENVHGAP